MTKLIGRKNDRLNMLFLILFLFTFSDVYAQEKLISKYRKSYIFTPREDLNTYRGKFKYPLSDSKVSEKNITRSIENNQNILKKLARVKFEIINGNLNKAKVILLDTQFDQDFSMPIQYRYLAIIHFIEGDYQRSLELLQKKEMYQEGNQKHICLLRSLNLLILNRDLEALNDWTVCRSLTTSTSSHLWMDTLVSLKTSKNKDVFKKAFADINIENERGDFLRIYLKLALYLNKQDKVFPRIPYLGSAVYEDNLTREILGLLFYREGEVKTAYQFIEDLESPNSENIKGNLYLAQKKYELAYAQFKLALQKKKNSINALERVIPVAWILRQWKDGLKYTQKLEVAPEDELKKLTLIALFQTQIEEYKTARGILEKVYSESKASSKVEVHQLLSYVSMKNKDLDSFKLYNSKSCSKLDGFSCWLQFHLDIWDDFSITIMRDEPIHAGVNLLKTFREGFDANPIKEEIYLGQPDIEELDNELLQKYK